MADTLSCQRETLHSQQLRSKKSIDSDHGIYRDSMPTDIVGCRRGSVHNFHNVAGRGATQAIPVRSVERAGRLTPGL